MRSWDEIRDVVRTDAKGTSSDSLPPSLDSASGFVTLFVFVSDPNPKENMVPSKCTNYSGEAIQHAAPRAPDSLCRMFLYI